MDVVRGCEAAVSGLGPAPPRGVESSRVLDSLCSSHSAAREDERGIGTLAVYFGPKCVYAGDKLRHARSDFGGSGLCPKARPTTRKHLASCVKSDISMQQEWNTELLLLWKTRGAQEKGHRTRLLLGRCGDAWGGQEASRKGLVAAISVPRRARQVPMAMHTELHGKLCLHDRYRGKARPRVGRGAAGARGTDCQL